MILQDLTPCFRYGWTPDKQLEKLNPGRDIYRAPDGSVYSLDTQHGTWEKINPKNGTHEGEFRLIDKKFIERSIDNTGRHNLKVK